MKSVAIVILNEAERSEESQDINRYKQEILRLAPQNDIATQSGRRESGIFKSFRMPAYYMRA
jgi:hypothetical protein